MSYRGMDPGVITQVADGMAQQAGSLDLVTSHVDSLLQQVSVLWPGQDAHDFHQFWLGQHRPHLRATVEGLTTAVTGLRAQVQAQVDVSGGNAEGIAGTVGPSPVGPSVQDDRLHRLTEALKAGILFDLRDPVAAAAQVAALGLWARTLPWDDQEYLLRAASRSGWFTASGRVSAIDGIADGKAWGGMLRAAGLKAGVLVGGEGVAANLAAGVGKSAKVIEPLGKLLGPMGLMLQGATAFGEFEEGRTARATLDLVSTGLGGAALMTPPPADVILGGLAGGITLGELVYDHWDTITAAGDEMVGDLANAGSAVVSGAEHLSSDIADGVARDAKRLWPF